MDNVGVSEILWELNFYPEHLDGWVRCVIRISPPAINTSVGIPSGPGALQVCSCLMAIVVSAEVGGYQVVGSLDTVE